MSARQAIQAPYIVEIGIDNQKVTIDDAIARFLADVGRQTNKTTHANIQAIMDMFQQHLDSHGPDLLSPAESAQLEGKGKRFCETFASSRIIPCLDIFMRYCMMRELVADDDRRDAVNQVLANFLNWLSHHQYISEQCISDIFTLKTRLDRLTEKSWRAQQELARKYITQKPGKSYSETIPFGRHDIVKIEPSSILINDN